jgi:hypothetical protein
LESGGFAGEVTRLNCDRQFKPFVYLNGGAAGPAYLLMKASPQPTDWNDAGFSGHGQIRPFFEEGARRRPNELVRWYRTGNWLTDGKRVLMWEYPRQAPDGDQIEIVEVMEIEHGLIQHHRIYWGWFGVNQLTQSAARKATQTA